MESEGFEPSSKPRELMLSTRLDLIIFRSNAGSNQTKHSTYSLDTNSFDKDTQISRLCMSTPSNPPRQSLEEAGRWQNG